MDLTTIRALTFDVFGTVVDWRTSIIREGQALGPAHGRDVDWAAFADAWRGLYQPNMSKVRNGEMPWTKLDDLHRMALDHLLVDVQDHRRDRGRGRSLQPRVAPARPVA
jgi:2-haloacid dehalogenase